MPRPPSTQFEKCYRASSESMDYDRHYNFLSGLQDILDALIEDEDTTPIIEDAPRGIAEALTACLAAIREDVVAVKTEGDKHDVLDDAVDSVEEWLEDLEETEEED